MWATPRKTYRKNLGLPLGTFARRTSLKRRGLNLSAFGVRMSQLSPGLLMSVHRTIQTHGPIMRLASPSYGYNPRFRSSISPLSVNPSDERSGGTELYRGLIIPSRNDTGHKNDW